MENITRTRWMTTPVLVKASLLAGLSIIFTRVFSFMIPLAGLPALRIGFGGLPIMISGILFGPLVGGVVGLVADLIGFLLNPMGGTYFPGFTISAALTGIIPGLIYKWIPKTRKSLNFNLINAVSILMFAIGVITIMLQRNVLTVENSILLYNGQALSIIVTVLYLVLVLSFMLLPIYLGKFYKQNQADEMYSFDKIAFVVTVQYMIVSLGLNTIWLSILFQKGALIFLPGRILAGFVMIPMTSILLLSLSRLFKILAK